MVHVGWPARNDHASKHHDADEASVQPPSCRDKTELERGRPVGGRLEGELLGCPSTLPSQSSSTADALKRA